MPFTVPTGYRPSTGSDFIDMLLGMGKYVNPMLMPAPLGMVKGQLPEEVMKALTTPGKSTFAVPSGGLKPSNMPQVTKLPAQEIPTGGITAQPTTRMSTPESRWLTDYLYNAFGGYKR